MDVDVMVTDPLPPDELSLLRVPAAQRDKQVLQQLAKLVQRLAGDFFSTLSEEQITKLARSWRYGFFRPGISPKHAQQPSSHASLIGPAS